MGNAAHNPRMVYGLGGTPLTFTGPVDISWNGGVGPGTIGDVIADTILFTGGGGASIKAYGGRFWARYKITVSASTILDVRGSDALGAGGGFGQDNSILGPGSGGGASGTGAGSPGVNMSGSFAGVGGIGGTGGTGASGSGAAGGTSGHGPMGGQQFTFGAALTGCTFALGAVIQLAGGSGGGGGGGNGTAVGGGGGGGGNCILLAAPVIEIDGSVLANGGAGADGANGGTGNTGGGGGGGGGLIILIYDELIVGGSGTILASAGVGGAGGNGGPAGGGGTAGHIYHFNGLSTQLGPLI
jgi:hypothetical protein